MTTLEPVHDARMPNAPLRQPGDPTQGRQHSASTCLDLTFGLYMRHWVALLWFALIYLGGSIVVSLVPFGSLVLMAVAPGLLGGVCGALIYSERRAETMQFARMFEPFRSVRFLEMAIISLLLQIAIFIPFLAVIGGVVMIIIAADSGSLPGLLAAGIALTAVGLISGLYLQLRLSISLVVSAEKPPHAGFNPLEPMQQSWRMTRDHAVELLGVWFVVLVAGFASMLVLCVGYAFVGMQLFATAMTASYLLLLPVQRRGGRFADPDRCPWCDYDLRASDGAQCPECGNHHPARLPGGADRCRCCGYDLQGLSGRPCPECGTALVSD